MSQTQSPPDCKRPADEPPPATKGPKRRRPGTKSLYGDLVNREVMVPAHIFGEDGASYAARVLKPDTMHRGCMVVKVKGMPQRYYFPAEDIRAWLQLAAPTATGSGATSQAQQLQQEEQQQEEKPAAVHPEHEGSPTAAAARRQSAGRGGIAAVAAAKRQQAAATSKKADEHVLPAPGPAATGSTRQGRPAGRSRGSDRDPSAAVAPAAGGAAVDSKQALPDQAEAAAGHGLLRHKPLSTRAAGAPAVTAAGVPGVGFNDDLLGVILQVPRAQWASLSKTSSSRAVQPGGGTAGGLVTGAEAQKRGPGNVQAQVVGVDDSPKGSAVLLALSGGSAGSLLCTSVSHVRRWQAAAGGSPSPAASRELREAALALTEMSHSMGVVSGGSVQVAQQQGWQQQADVSSRPAAGCSRRVGEAAGQGDEGAEPLPPGGAIHGLGARGEVQQQAGACGAAVKADHLSDGDNSRDVGQQGQQGQQGTYLGPAAAGLAALGHVLGLPVGDPDAESMDHGMVAAEVAAEALCRAADAAAAVAEEATAAPQKGGAPADTALTAVAADQEHTSSGHAAPCKLS